MKKTAKTMADVFWEAANEHLWDGEPHSGGTPYSCHALYEAQGYWDTSYNNPINRFVNDLGCNPGDAYAFNAREGTKRQGNRYMWLLLAMHVAEDEGLTV